MSGTESPDFDRMVEGREVARETRLDRERLIAVRNFMAQLIVAQNGASLNGAVTIPKQTIPASVYDAALAACYDAK